MGSMLIIINNWREAENGKKKKRQDAFKEFIQPNLISDMKQFFKVRSEIIERNDPNEALMTDEHWFLNGKNVFVMNFLRI